MDSKALFYKRLGLAIAIGGVLTTVVYTRDNTVIYFWNCTASVRECNIVMGTIFFFLTTVAAMGILYANDILRLVINRFWKKHIISLIPVENINAPTAHELPFSLSSVAGIKVHNDNLFEISECFATLEYAKKAFINKGKIFHDGGWWSRLGTESKKELRWVGKDFSGSNCKVLLSSKSKENIILVAGIFSRLKIEKKKKVSNEINRFFSFAFCETSPEYMLAPSLFKVKIRINGKVSGKSDIVNILKDTYIHILTIKTPKMVPFLMLFGQVTR